VGSKPPVALFFALVVVSLFECSPKRSTAILVLVSVTLLLLATALWFSYALPRIADLRIEGSFPIAKQLKKAAVMDEPIRYFFKGLKVFFGMIWGYFSSLYGQMGWLDATISKPHMAVGRILFVWALFVSLIPLGVRRLRSLSRRTISTDLVAALVGTTYVAGVMIALYLTWSKPGIEHMGGGRSGALFLSTSCPSVICFTWTLQSHFGVACVFLDRHRECAARIGCDCCAALLLAFLARRFEPRLSLRRLCLIHGLNVFYFTIFIK
jgi:hypothetical protein